MAYYGPLKPVSNRESWEFSFGLDDANTGVPVELSSYSIEASVEDDCRSQRLYFSTGNGRITINGTQAAFIATPVEMSGLCPGRYKFFLKVARDGFATQIMDGDCVLTVVEGGPR